MFVLVLCVCLVGRQTPSRSGQQQADGRREHKTPPPPFPNQPLIDKSSTNQASKQATARRTGRRSTTTNKQGMQARPRPPSSDQPLIDTSTTNQESEPSKSHR